MNQTSLWRSYARAARDLLERAVREGTVDELAMPIFFLQRHAIELTIKDVIEALEGHAQNEAVARAAEHEWSALWTAWHAGESAGAATHDLDKLIDIAKGLLVTRAWPAPLPVEFQGLADLIGKFEDDGKGQARVDRSRYRVMKRKGGKKSTEDRRDLASVRMLEADGNRWKPVTTEIDLGEIQQRLDELLVGPMRYGNDDDDTFLSGLAREEEAGDSFLLQMGRG